MLTAVDVWVFTPQRTIIPASVPLEQVQRRLCRMPTNLQLLFDDEEYAGKSIPVQDLWALEIEGR